MSSQWHEDQAYGEKALREMEERDARARRIGEAVLTALGSLDSVVVLEKAADQYAAMKMVFAERIVRAVATALRGEL